MAKQKLEVDQIRNLLHKLNPKKLGANADPVIPQKTKFILTGKKSQGANEEKKTQFTLTTKLSEEAKKANPGLTEGKYFRVLKTDDIKDVTSPDEVMHTGRRPVPDNIFERQQPIVFDQITRLLKVKFTKDDEKNEIGKEGERKYFREMSDDPQGNPRVKMTNPILGAFITLNVPGHLRYTAAGKALQGARKDITSGTFGNPEKIVFRTMQFFVYEHDIDRVEEIAIGLFQRQVEPALVTEVKIEKIEGGLEIKKEINSGASAADEIHNNEDEPIIIPSGEDNVE
jgi:hypothetical protein